MATTTVVTMVTCATLMMMTLLSSCVVVNARPVEKTHQKPLDVYIFDSKVPVTIANEIMKLQQAANFKGSTIPKQFLLYDRNHDWRVSLEELAFATSTKLSDAREPFSAADLNRDSYISMREFTQAPWIFEADGVTMVMDTLDEEDNPANNDEADDDAVPAENV